MFAASSFCLIEMMFNVSELNCKFIQGFELNKIKSSPIKISLTLNDNQFPVFSMKISQFLTSLKSS